MVWTSLQHSKHGLVVALALTFSHFSIHVSCVTTTIKNDAIRLMNGLQVLGRGYSTSINKLYGSCMEDFNMTEIEPSYNYECE